MRPDRKLRVVQLVARLGAAGGGAQAVARQIALGLDRERFDSTLCVSRVHLPRYSSVDVARVTGELANGGVRYLHLKRRRRYDLWRWSGLVTFLRRARVDVIHAHQYPSNFWAAVLGRLARVPVLVAHEHSWAFEGRPVRRFIDREVIARNSSVIIAVSEQDRRRMIETEGIDPRCVTVLHNGIVGRDPTPGRDLRSEMGIPPHAPVIGMIGGLRPEKGISAVLEAAAVLAPRHPGLKVLIAGEGDRSLLEPGGPLGLDDVLVPLGFRSDIPDVLAACDVAVCPSLREGSPLSVMEYMEAGIPIVASRVGGIPEVIHEGVHGRLVPPDDPARLADAVTSMLRDPAGSAAMGARAQERRRREFDLGGMINRLEDLYLELHAARSPR
jgi:glycosyltransferase involved in cell wall biosynthesis